MFGIRTLFYILNTGKCNAALDAGLAGIEFNIYMEVERRKPLRSTIKRKEMFKMMVYDCKHYTI